MVAGKTASKTSSLKVRLQKVEQKAEIVIKNIVSSRKKLDEDVKEIPVKIRRMRDEVNKMFDELEVTVVRNAESFKVETVTVTFDFDETLKLPPLPITDFVPGQLSFKSYPSDFACKITPDITPMSLTPVISVDLKQSDGDSREPLFSGIAFLPDGRLVAVDNPNKECLIYNEKLEKVGSYQLSFWPQSVVAVSEQEIIITSCEYKLYTFGVNILNQITLDRTCKVKKKYGSICLKDGRHFVVGTIDHYKSVHILSSTGEVKDFNIFPNKKYAIDTSACNYIRNRNKIVLTDRHEHTVYIYDVTTNTRLVVKDKQMKEPYDVTVGPSDTILVCSRNKNSIVQISHTGQILSSYKLYIKLPKRICVSFDKSFLVVTNSCRGEIKLQKFEIS